MKKKILSYLLYAMTALPLGGVGGGLLTSCSLKEDADFGETASQRSEAHIQSIEELLPSAPNGWLVEYYGNLALGGYNMMMKFSDDLVTIGCEKFGPSHIAGLDDDGKIITSTSRYTHYKMEQSMGSILSFDEFNPTFHYFSMPDNPDYTREDEKADGLYGDFEFRVIRADKDTIILRGKKHNNRIIMTPIPENKTWESYITEAAETVDYMTSTSYTLTGEARTDDIAIKVTNNGKYRCLIFEYKDTLGLNQQVLAPYLANKDGYKFYTAVTVNGMELDGLLKGDTQDYFLFKNNPKLQLNGVVPPLTKSLTENTWYMVYENLGAYAQPKWDAMMDKLKTADKNKKEIKIYFATFGKTTDNKVAASMSTSADTPYWGYSFSEYNNGTEISFTSKSSVSNKAGKDYYNKLGWKNALEPLFGHRFKLTSDNPRRPSYITLTDVNNPENVITLLSTPTNFMDRSYYNEE